MYLDNLRNTILTYIQVYFKNNGKSPTIKSICADVDGANRSNFYALFPGGIGEACTIAKITVPEKRIESTAKAVSSRAFQRTKLPQITLNENASANINTISYIENKTPQEIIDKLIENDRILRSEYGISILDEARLLSFLKNCENTNVSKNRIIDSLIAFTNLRLDKLSVENYNLLIQLWKDMISNKWTFDHVICIYQDKTTAYHNGYSDCVDRVTQTIIEEIDKNYQFESVRPRARSLGTKVSLALNYKRLGLK